MELSATSNTYSSTGQLCSSSPEVNSLSCLTEYIARSNLRPKLRKSQPEPRVMFSRSMPENAESRSRHPLSTAARRPTLTRPAHLPDRAHWPGDLWAVCCAVNPNNRAAETGRQVRYDWLAGRASSGIAAGVQWTPTVRRNGPARKGCPRHGLAGPRARVPVGPAGALDEAC